MGLLLLGGQLMSIGFLAELFIAYHAPDSRGYSISRTHRRRHDDIDRLVGDHHLATPMNDTAADPDAAAPPQRLPAADRRQHGHDARAHPGGRLGRYGRPRRESAQQDPRRVGAEAAGACSRKGVSGEALKHELAATRRAMAAAGARCGARSSAPTTAAAGVRSARWSKTTCASRALPTPSTR